ncbi:hypothetical protein C8R44DRAFT_733959 [Mycena epipterygia]|nr:hypothetical protein C8R44DRAFT_733959 [Mycena epipterygia]
MAPPIPPVPSINCSALRIKSKATKVAKYSGGNLYDILQTAINVELFTAKYGEKGTKKRSSGTLFISWASPDPASAPEVILMAIEGTTYEVSLGAPLNKLMAQRHVYEDKTDAEKEKLKKCSSSILSQKVDEDKKGGDAIRNASLNRSWCAAMACDADSSNDDIVIIDKPTPSTNPALHGMIPATPTPPIHTPALLHEWSPPASILDSRFNSKADSDIKFISHKFSAIPISNSDIVTIKLEPTPSII